MSRKLLSALVVSAGLMVPAVAWAGADVCYVGDNPGQFMQLLHNGIPHVISGIPGQTQNSLSFLDPGDAAKVAQGENLLRSLNCPTPAQPD